MEIVIFKKIRVFKKDNLKFGLILGLMAPVLSLLVYYFMKFYPVFSLGEFLSFMRNNKPQITAVSVPCLVLNIVLFTYYINVHKDQTAKGIFVATLIYAILSLLLKVL